MKFRTILTAISLGLCAVGLLILFSIFYHSHKNSLTSANPVTVQPVIAKPETISGIPIKLDIPKLNLKLSIVAGEYNPKTGAWSLSKDKAHFALLSSPVNNQEGNTLIYGHYRPEVFAKLKNIKKDDEVFITTDNGYRFVYKFQEAKTVKPNDTSIFAYQGKPQLTLQTCTGIFMENRQLFFFSLIRYDKV
jgi:LPXTG-site transpeptidase (sortase) family protein